MNIYRQNISFSLIPNWIIFSLFLQHMPGTQQVCLLIKYLINNFKNKIGNESFSSLIVLVPLISGTAQLQVIL